MKIIDIEITRLKEYENNPRVNDKAVAKVAASIDEFGFKVPIVVDSNNVIICGHTRLKAAKQLGLEVVPCIVADDLTDEQIKAFRLADNKTSNLPIGILQNLTKNLPRLTLICRFSALNTAATREQAQRNATTFPTRFPRFTKLLLSAPTRSSKNKYLIVYRGKV